MQRSGGGAKAIRRFPASGRTGCVASVRPLEHLWDQSHSPRARPVWCGRIREEQIVWGLPTGIAGLRGPDAAYRSAPPYARAGVQPRRNARRNQTQYRAQKYRPDRLASAMPTLRRRRFHSWSRLYSRNVRAGSERIYQNARLTFCPPARYRCRRDRPDGASRSRRNRPCTGRRAPPSL